MSKEPKMPKQKDRYVVNEYPSSISIEDTAIEEEIISVRRTLPYAKVLALGATKARRIAKEICGQLNAGKLK